MSEFRIPRQTTPGYSYVWYQTFAYTSNILTIESITISDGVVIRGVLTATYGAHLPATFDTWGESSITEWSSEGLGHPVTNIDIELDPMGWIPAPMSG